MVIKMLIWSLRHWTLTRYYILGPEEDLVSLWKVARRKIKDMGEENEFFQFKILSDIVTFKKDMQLRDYCFNKNGLFKKEDVTTGTKAIIIEGQEDSEEHDLAKFLHTLIEENVLSEQTYFTSEEGVALDRSLFSSSFHAFRKESSHETFENEYIHAEPRFFRVI